LAEQQHPATGISLENEHIMVYTDGSCTRNGNPDAQCSAGVWFAHNNEHNMSTRIGGEHISNQVGELATIIIALEKTTNYTPLTIKTDSQYAIDRLTTHLERWEDKGWLGTKNKEWFQQAVYLLR
jgi:ribonuclease HI